MACTRSVFDGTTGQTLDPDGFEHHTSTQRLTSIEDDHYAVELDSDSSPSTPVAVIPKGAWIWTSNSRYQVGARVEVHSLSVLPAVVRCFRYGAQKRQVAEFPVAPDREDATLPQSLVAEGLPAHPTPSTIDSTGWTPGLYGLELVVNGATTQCHPFVIEAHPSASSAGTILVIANTQTWHCYNYFGGRSRYRNGPAVTGDRADSPPTGWKHNLRRWVGGVLASRRHPWTLGELSVHRPHHSPGLACASPDDPYLDHLAGNEWRSLAWLEQNEIDYHLIADASLVRWAAATTPPVVVLNGHSEYWTSSGIKALAKLHHECSVGILNISGNSMHALVDWPTSTSLNCEVLRIRRSLSRADPARLIGTRTNLGNINTCAPYATVDPEHFLWGSPPPPRFGASSLMTDNQHGIELVDGACPGNGFDVLNGSGASGWEVDRRSHRSFNVLATGENPGGGADIVWRPAKGSRGAAFGIPSILTPAALGDASVAALTMSALQTMSSSV